ncbi:MAG TPA: DUF4203 domain-containing protein [Propionibacteriaceae bacterium]
MTSTTIGVVAALIGLALVLRGYATIRAIISLFGGLVGFVIGSALVAQVTHTALFQSQASLIGGAIGAVVCGLLAFFVYKVAMIGGLAAIGFTLGTSAMVALHVDNRAASLVAGIIAAIALAIVAWRLDLPGLILVILTVLTGASVTVLGTMVALGKVAPPSIGQAQITAVVADGWGWYALYVGLVVLGLAAQWRYLKVRNRIRTKWGKS